MELKQGPQLHIPNIGENEQRKRRNMGLVALAIGVIAGLVLVALGWPWWVRLLLFLPFAGGMSGVLQAREKT